MKMNFVKRSRLAALLTSSAIVLCACPAVDAISGITAGQTDITIKSLKATNVPAGTQIKVKAGSALPMTITFSDTGKASADFHTQVCLNRYNYWDDLCPVPLPAIATSKLNSASTRDDNVTLQIPMAALDPDQDGSYYADDRQEYHVKMCADTKAVVVEADEGNNCEYSEKIQVLPNFEQSCQGAPAIAIGQTITSAYLATNCQIYALGAPAAVRSFAASAGTTYTVTVKAPVASPSGTLKVAVLNDQGDVVAQNSTYRWYSTDPETTLTLSAPIGIAGTYYITVRSPATFTLDLK